MLSKLTLETKCVSVSQLYRHAVYSNTEAGPEAQSTAVQAVLWHELDRPDATPDERQTYHQFCQPGWCDYTAWVLSGQPAHAYVRLYANNYKGRRCLGRGVTIEG